MTTAAESPALTSVHDALEVNAATLNGDNGSPLTSPVDLETPAPDLPPNIIKEIERAEEDAKREDEGINLAEQYEGEALDPRPHWLKGVAVDEVDDLQEALSDNEDVYESDEDEDDDEGVEMSDGPLDLDVVAKMRKKRQDFLGAQVEHYNAERRAELQRVLDGGEELDDVRKEQYQDLFGRSPPAKAVEASLDDFSAMPSVELSPADETVEGYPFPSVSRDISPPDTPGVPSPHALTQEDLKFLQTPAGRGIVDTLMSGQATPKVFEGKPRESFYGAIVAKLDTLASDEFKSFADQLSAAAEEPSATETVREMAKAVKAASDIARGEADKFRGSDWDGPESAAEKGAWAIYIQGGLDPDGKDWREAVDRTSAAVTPDSERLEKFVKECQAASST